MTEPTPKEIAEQLVDKCAYGESFSSSMLYRGAVVREVESLVKELLEDRELICKWLWEYANTGKWRDAADTDEIRHFVGHAVDYIRMGEHATLSSSAPASGEVK